MLEKKLQEYLLKKPQVVGVGRGFKEVGGKQTEEEAIIVLVDKKLPFKSLLADQFVPKTLEGVVTDVIEVGELKAHPRGKLATSPIAYGIVEEVNRTSRIRPALPGVSIGHYRITAGTFGAVVYDRSTGKPFILSNNHVLANVTNGRDGRARIGDKILQPGALDGGKSNHNIIGTLAKFTALNAAPKANVVDCALAKPTKNALIVPEILGIGKVQGVTPPVLRMQVQKSGRTTGLTTGQIRALNVTVDVSYGPGRVLRFEKQILTTPMSDGGDSGSLVLDQNNLAVGLLFAGSSQSTLLNPIEEVLNVLSIKI